MATHAGECWYSDSTRATRGDTRARTGTEISLQVRPFEILQQQLQRAWCRHARTCGTADTGLSRPTNRRYASRTVAYEAELRPETSRIVGLCNTGECDNIGRITPGDVMGFECLLNVLPRRQHLSLQFIIDTL